MTRRTLNRGFTSYFDISFTDRTRPGTRTRVGFDASHQEKKLEQTGWRRLLPGPKNRDQIGMFAEFVMAVDPLIVVVEWDWYGDPAIVNPPTP